MDVIISVKGRDLIIETLTSVDLSGIRKLLRYDSKFHFYRTFPFHYKKVIEWLGPRYEVEDLLDVMSQKASLIFRPSFELREYQEDALRAWIRADYAGVIVLPTGSGKTFLALQAMNLLRLKTLIVVPTINLLEQWRRMISTFLGLNATDIGIWGGGKREKKDITIITYDSAHQHFFEFVDFGLLIFDEVHHLPARNYRKIAQGLPTPKRMGLSATPERPDELHKLLDNLVGEVVFRLTPRQLEGYLSPFEVKKVWVELSEKEREEYLRLRKTYLTYCRKRGIKFFKARDFQRLVYLSFRDEEAREALRAHRLARRIALNAEKKISKVDELLCQHVTDKVVIFSEFNSIVSALAQTFLIPTITHKTGLAERREILEHFRTGRYTKLATSKVLDEGWDVKDANIGIIVSGSGTKRQLIQRLGRLLRKKAGKRAVLYEVISKGTMEVGTAGRRALREVKRQI
jgi:superfamily II DNA or RNA helicase